MFQLLNEGLELYSAGMPSASSGDAERKKSVMCTVLVISSKRLGRGKAGLDP